MDLFFETGFGWYQKVLITIKENIEMTGKKDTFYAIAVNKIRNDINNKTKTMNTLKEKVY